METTIFNGTGKFKNKIVADYDKMAQATEALRSLGYKIVMTIGSWDLLHIGHVRYLNKAKTLGDILVVGTDSDRGIKFYKGELRPIIPEDERMEMLTYQSCVDLVSLVDDIDDKGKWQYGLVKKVKPDVFVAVEGSYPKTQITELKKLCGEVVVLPRQAEKTSTSRLIQTTLKKHLIDMLTTIEKR